MGGWGTGQRGKAWARGSRFHGAAPSEAWGGLLRGQAVRSDYSSGLGPDWVSSKENSTHQLGQLALRRCLVTASIRTERFSFPHAVHQAPALDPMKLLSELHPCL